MAEIGQERRYTLLTVFSMVLASAVAVLVGLAGAAMWVPNAMTLGGARYRAGNEALLDAIFLFLSAGPVVAGVSLLLGWLVFLGRRPGAGVRLTFFGPVIWAVAVLAYLAIVAVACDGEFTCGF